MIRTLLGPISRTLILRFPVPLFSNFPYPYSPISRTLILRFSVPLYFPSIREYLHDPAQLRLDLVGAEDRAVVVVQRERVDPPAVVHLCMYTSFSGAL